jgi:sortase A
VARLKALGGDIDLVVLAGGSGRTLAFGPGHLSASAMPGQRGNAVIAGHRDTHFGFLQRLEVGQPLALETVDGRSHLYQVVNIDVVDSRRSSLLLDTEDSVVSLVTCYPFDALEPGGPMRYVVTARKLF